MKTRRTVNALRWSPERVAYPSEGCRPSLTNPCGTITQHYQYLPFGENFIHQKGTSHSYHNPYEFNGKEKDLEMRSILAYQKVKINNHAKLRSILAYHTVKINNHAKTGYNYYGARHYNASWGVPALSQPEGRQSVDPLAEKYPSHSAYNYCMNNPVMLVDPDGRKVDPAMDDEVKNRINPEHKDYNPAFHDLYKKLDEDKNAIFKFNKVKAKSESGLTKYGDVTSSGRNNDGMELIDINYSFDEGVRSKENALLEETFHATQFLKGAFGFQDNGGGNWKGFGVDLYDEAEAKVFAATHVSGMKTIEERNLLKAHSKNQDGYAGAIALIGNKPGYTGLSKKRMNVVETITAKSGNSHHNNESLFNSNGQSSHKSHIMRIPK